MYIHIYIFDNDTITIKKKKQHAYFARLLRKYLIFRYCCVENVDKLSTACVDK